MNIISGVGNTVAKVADAMDTTDACTLAIEVKHGPKSLINIISTFEMKMTLSEVFDLPVQIKLVDSFKMGHFILLYIVETQKFHLEHCK